MHHYTFYALTQFLIIMNYNYKIYGTEQKGGFPNNGTLHSLVGLCVSVSKFIADLTLTV